ncbi:putative bifunctional diguanylate cyclase/phosphodiesterase [Antarcticirhabdus aurantiaca]|uniref:Bifunctional diguanylate cyclase/phosphodiesterase n=1 Tax=Antarcticirhabdus aurantiaca TaxID=2606717 RepID=A0ACD4NVF5_9HYPH|nr:bifunctional diguanylate cyclase/phosphodiesterase [Antarcticirhabdus aurantiaca]WAJ30582.1 bifunctional diguanylate cyclase/phosphodiesterase [Jeongeuplla avenae]
MIIAFAKRYWITTLGGAVVSGLIALGAFSVGTQTVEDLVGTTLRQKGARFATFLTEDPSRLNAFLTGLARDPDAEQRVRAIAGLSDIDTFVIFDDQGNETYRSRSERYKWLLRDRPGGMTAGDKLAVDVLKAKADQQVVDFSSGSEPSVITPLRLEGRTVGYASVGVDTSAQHAAFGHVMTGAIRDLLVLVFIVAGVPSVFYLRRKRRMEEADERIHFLANHDVLTTLFNRARMQAETDRLLATARATREQMAYVYLDIDGFSEINDEVGQSRGDELLRIVAQRLSSVLDRNDLLGRMGADDFVFLRRRVQGPIGIADLARRVARAVAEPVELGDRTIQLQISMGVARMPADGRSHAELQSHAEMALLHHKANKLGDFSLYDPSMNEDVARRRQIEAQVRLACETNSFELFYQPIVGGPDLELRGFEALLRMPNGSGGHISPAVFVPIAEARGYIQSIGTWVIQEACRQIAAWPEHLYVSVNLSTVQFRGDDLVDVVKGAMEAAGITGERLEVEIVESLVLDRSDAVLRQLEQLKELGVSIAMDDFGTGYSSLSYLWRFGFDKLKIDQSFMKAFAAGEPNVSQIIETIITMAHQMGMSVTTEGVETEEQVALLRRLGSDYIQGFYYGRPVAATEAAAEWISRHPARRLAAPQTAACPAGPELDADWQTGAARA